MLNIKYPFGADGSLYGAIPRGSFPTVLTVRIDDSILRYKYILAESIVPAITNVKLSDSSVTSGYSIRACATVQNVGKARGNMRVTFSGDQVSSSSPGETFSLDAGASTDVCTDVAGGTTIGTCAGTLIVTASDTFSGKSVSKAVCITVDELKFDASGTATDVSGGIIGSADLSGEAAPTVIKATEKTDTNGTSDNTMLYVLIGVIVLVVVGYFLTKKPQGKR